MILLLVLNVFPNTITVRYRIEGFLILPHLYPTNLHTKPPCHHKLTRAIIV